MYRLPSTLSTPFISLLWLLLLIFVNNLSFCDSRHAIYARSTDENLIISPPGTNRGKYVVKEKSTFRVSCILNDVDGTFDNAHLSWHNENDHKIDAESSSSVFTIGLHKHGSKKHKLSLVFTQIALRDAGTYKCVGTNSKQHKFAKSVEIVVVVRDTPILIDVMQVLSLNINYQSQDLTIELRVMLPLKVLMQTEEPSAYEYGNFALENVQIEAQAHALSIDYAAIDWNENNNVVGGMLDESLTVNCGAVGFPTPEIRITDENGEPLSAREFVIAADEVTVPKLTKTYINRTIKCLAIQDYIEYETVTTEENEIKIDVWYAPEFSSASVDKYAIVGRPAIPTCNVISSNPPVLFFRFFRSSSELKNSDQYEIVTDISKQTANLKIKAVGEEHFGEFSCEATNIKAKSYQQIFLKESSAPGEVQTSLHHVGNQSLTWKIEDDEGELPTISYIIEYINKAHLDEIASPNGNLEKERLWSSHSLHSKFNKTKNSLYTVDGLQKETKYVFRIRAENDAGQGDSITIVASTLFHSIPKAPSSSSTRIHFGSFLVFHFILFRMISTQIHF